VAFRAWVSTGLRYCDGILGVLLHNAVIKERK
jgi:hypothetical protein